MVVEIVCKRFSSAQPYTLQLIKLVEAITTRPIWVDLKGKDSVPETVHHALYEIDPEEDLPWKDSEIAPGAKFPEEQPPSDNVHKTTSMSDFDKQHPEALRYSEKIKKMKPKALVKIADSFKMAQCLVFCRTNIDCDNLEAYLHKLDGTKKMPGKKMESGKENPYSCVVLAGARQQKERSANLEAFREGDVRFLICTDVAARGIDIASLPFVINMTLPDDIENYIHRVGRCGRAERMGLAVSIVATKREKVWYHKCPTRGKACLPAPGNTKLTIPFGPDGKNLPEDKNRWWIDEGGCCVWYDETELREKVQTRLGGRLMVMNPEDFSVRGFLDSPLPGRGRQEEDEGEKEAPSRRALKRQTNAPKKAVVYGAKKNDATVVAMGKQVAAIAPVVSQLTDMEQRVQQLFGRLFAGTYSKEMQKAQKPTDSQKQNMPVCGSASGLPSTAAASSAIAATSEKRPAEAPAAAQKPKKKMRW